MNRDHHKTQTGRPWYPAAVQRALERWCEQDAEGHWIMKTITDEQVKRLLYCLRLEDKLKTKSDKRISELLLKLVWAKLPINSLRAMVVDEAISRLERDKHD